MKKSIFYLSLGLSLLAAKIYATPVSWELFSSSDYPAGSAVSTPPINSDGSGFSFSASIAEGEGAYQITGFRTDPQGNSLSTILQGGTATSIQYPILFVNKTGYAVVVWKVDNDIYYAIYNVVAGGWELPAQIVTTDENATSLNLFGNYHGTDGNPQVFLTYVTQASGPVSEVVYTGLASFSSPSWPTPTILFTVSAPALNLTPIGQITDDGSFGAIIWTVGSPPSDTAILLSTYNGSSFDLSPETVDSSTDPTNFLIMPSLFIPSDGSGDIFGSYIGAFDVSSGASSYNCYCFYRDPSANITTQSLTPPAGATTSANFSTLPFTFPAPFTKTLSTSTGVSPNSAVTIVNFSDNTDDSAVLACYSGVGANANNLGQPTIFSTTSGNITSHDASIAIIPGATPANTETVTLSFTVPGGIIIGGANLYADSFDLSELDGSISQLQAPTLLQSGVEDYRGSSSINPAYITAKASGSPLAAGGLIAGNLSGNPLIPSMYRVWQLVVRAQVLPPPGITGKQKTCRFLVDSELYNVIQWSLSPTSNVVSYLILRDGFQIASVPGNQDKYRDHNRKKGVSYTYSVIAVDDKGNQSTAATVTIP